VAKPAGVCGELEHPDGAGLLQVWRGVEPGREINGEVAILIRRSKCEAIQLVAGSGAFAFAGYCYLST